MEKSSFEQRLRQRLEPQQQPQQSVLHVANTARNTQDSPRNVLHAIAIAQARKQSGRL